MNTRPTFSDNAYDFSELLEGKVDQELTRQYLTTSLGQSKSVVDEYFPPVDPEKS